MTMTTDMRLSQECLSLMLSEGGWKTVWKKLLLDPAVEKLHSPYQSHYSWEPGWLDATSGQNPHDAPPYAIVYHHQLIDSRALHVYFNHPDEYSCKDVILGPDSTIVPMRAHARDFIAAGASGKNIEATFKRLYLGYIDCEMAVKDALERRERHKETINPLIKGATALAQSAKDLAAVQSIALGSIDWSQQQAAQQQQLGQLFNQGLASQLGSIRQQPKPMTQDLVVAQTQASSQQALSERLRCFIDKLLNKNSIQSDECLEASYDRVTKSYRIDAVKTTSFGRKKHRSLGGISKSALMDDRS